MHVETGSGAEREGVGRVRRYVRSDFEDDLGVRPERDAVWGWLSNGAEDGSPLGGGRGSNTTKGDL